MNNDMTKGAILPVLIKFTVPILLGNLFQQFYTICDTIIVGRTLGADALAAVGATGTICFLILGFASGIAGGFSVVTSQKFGAGDKKGVRLSFTNGIMMVLIISIVMTIGCILGMDSILKLMNTPENIYKESYNYIIVICAGLTGTVAYNLFASDLRAIGNSKIPLYFLILSSVINIGLDFLFILAFGWGTAGAAGATVVSQFVSAVLCLAYIYKKEELLRPQKGDWKFNSGIVKSELFVGLPMGLQYAITASGTMVMQSATNTFGSVAVAANTATGKVSGIFTSMFMALGQSIATYTGQNYGKRDMLRIKKGLKLSMYITAVYGIVAALVVMFALPYELALFFSASDDMSSLLPYAEICAAMWVPFYIPLGFIFLFRNAMQGANHSILAMVAGFIELIVRVACAVIAINTHEYWIACFCDPAAWIAAGIYCTAAFYISAGKTKWPEVEQTDTFAFDDNQSKELATI